MIFLPEIHRSMKDYAVSSSQSGSNFQSHSMPELESSSGGEWEAETQSQTKTTSFDDLDDSIISYGFGNASWSGFFKTWSFSRTTAQVLAEVAKGLRA